MSVQIVQPIPADLPYQEDPFPAMLDVPQAAHLLGIGRTLAYELIRTGRWPTPVVRVGRLIRIPSEPIRELLATGRVD